MSQSSLFLNKGACRRALARHCLIIILFALSTKAGFANGQTVSAPTSFTRAVIIERYDEEGQWRPVPRKAIATGESADRLGKCFPELDTEKLEHLTVTHAPMRFEISLTRANGKDICVWINPELTKWWDENHVYKLNHSAPQVVLESVKEAREDQSLVLKFSPVVKVEIIDREDGYGALRRPTIKTTRTGEEAERLAKGFPEIGLKRIPQLADGGGYRFNVTFTRADGERIEIHVIDQPGEKWLWYEGQSYWELPPSTASTLLWLCRGAKEEPSIIMPNSQNR